MVGDLAKAPVIIISFYKQSQAQRSACALAHDVKELCTGTHLSLCLLCACVYVVCFSENHSVQPHDGS